MRIGLKWTPSTAISKRKRGKMKNGKFSKNKRKWKTDYGRKFRIKLTLRCCKRNSKTYCYNFLFHFLKLFDKIFSWCFFFFFFHPRKMLLKYSASPPLFSVINNIFLFSLLSSHFFLAFYIFVLLIFLLRIKIRQHFSVRMLYCSCILNTKKKIRERVTFAD